MLFNDFDNVINNVINGLIQLINYSKNLEGSRKNLFKCFSMILITQLMTQLVEQFNWLIILRILKIWNIRYATLFLDLPLFYDTNIAYFFVICRSLSPSSLFWPIVLSTVWGRRAREEKQHFVRFWCRSSLSLVSLHSVSLFQRSGCFCHHQVFVTNPPGIQSSGQLC